MDKVVVAAVQMRMRLPASVDEYRDEIRRFLRTAEGKHARLLIFPELGGLMLAPALLRDTRTNLLRSAEQGKRKRANPWQKIRGGAAGWLASMLKVDLRSAAAGLLDVNAQGLWDAYCEVFSALAREANLTLVAPSAYLPNQGKQEEKSILNQCAVFAPNGDLLGTQSKVLGSVEDEDLAQRGRTWEVIPTEVGRLGVMLGSDVLYPEVGRLLAYQEAEVLVLQGASSSAAAYNKTRAGILARMQDNQLFAVASWLVGESPLKKKGQPAYQGRSAIFAPQELTPRFNGVLVEMGSGNAEGIVSAEWEYGALRKLWEETETPMRRPRTSEDVDALIVALYTQLRALPAPAQSDVLALADAGANDATARSNELNDAGPAGEVYELDELPVVASVTSAWPLRPVALFPETEESAPVAESEEEGEHLPVVEVPVEEVEWPPRSYVDAPSEPTIRRDDETDEMDAIEEKGKS